MNISSKEIRVMKRRLRDYGRFVGADGFEVTSGHFRKHHHLDCGKPRCNLCHSDKVAGIPSIKQRRADLAMKEELAELGIA